MRKTANILLRRIYEFFGNPKYTPKPSLDDLNTKLEKYLNFNKGFFIEVGANDGYSQSNTYYLEFGRKWSGILVEALPTLYQKCLTMRKRSMIYNCALVAPDYKDRNITVKYAGLMSLVRGAMSPEKEDQHIKDGLKYQNLSGTYSIEVSARTLESILDEVKPSKIDFFSLDVEGYELNVLRGVNLKKYRPLYILVEARHYEDVNTYLCENGYRKLEKLSYHDYLYKNTEL